ncbi:hypothetical protein ANN_01313 [Periplaneta americana]|uniref:Uncharacterized protein n=1 Tax=Periplaneta americana TaxID=6978 RepID=A0ABQ8TT77_PERAM|nr:hypothetical protein ANN_01313 [Periplaneta americana]
MDKISTKKLMLLRDKKRRTRNSKDTKLRGTVRIEVKEKTHATEEKRWEIRINIMKNRKKKEGEEMGAKGKKEERKEEGKSKKEIKERRKDIALSFQGEVKGTIDSINIILSTPVENELVAPDCRLCEDPPRSSSAYSKMHKEDWAVGGEGSLVLYPGLRVFENKVLRKIFGAKRDEVTREWRKFNNTELHALYSSPDIIRNLKSRRLRWAGHVARMGESRNAYRVLVGRPEGKRPLGRPRRRWEDNIKMDLREVGYDDRDWINLAQDRDRWRAYVRAAMNLRVS